MSDTLSDIDSLDWPERVIFVAELYGRENSADERDAEGSTADSYPEPTGVERLAARLIELETELFDATTNDASVRQGTDIDLAHRIIHACVQYEDIT